MGGGKTNEHKSNGMGFCFSSTSTGSEGGLSAASQKFSFGPKQGFEAMTQSAKIQASIKATLQQRGGRYQEYSCKQVSWDDSSRSQTGFGLSSMGSNITDTTLTSKSGERLFTVRSDNWNEKLGVVSARDVALIAGNTSVSGAPLAPVTLEDVLRDMGSTYGTYTGMGSHTVLSHPDLDDQVSIRFQTVFIPVESNTSSSGGRATCEFASEAYNYSTHSDDDPRNLVLLCTTQGLAVQQDGRGKQKLFHHSVSRQAFGTQHRISRHWLEAEASYHKVGAAQKETEEEKANAIARGKATAAVIGTRAMGTRFNVLMTIQVPLKQQTRPPRGFAFGFAGSTPQVGAFGEMGGAGFGAAPQQLTFGGSASNESMPQMSGFGSFDAAPQQMSCFGGFGAANECSKRATVQPLRRPTQVSTPLESGTRNCSAARVSIGSKHDEWDGLATKGRTLSRHPTERVTVTVVIYNAVAGGVPSEADVVAAIDDMENLYQACAGGHGRLAESKFDAFKNSGGGNGQPMSAAKPFATMATQPQQVVNGSFFPMPLQPLPAPTPFKGSWPAGTPGVVYCNMPPTVSAALRAYGSVPETNEGIAHLHDRVALVWLGGGIAGGMLSEAYHTFRAINEFHVNITGLPHNTALYNIACCVAIATRDDPSGILVSSGMLGRNAGFSFGAIEQLKARGLEVAISWLRQAKAAGYANESHMNSDPDLSALHAIYGAL